jgi:hypothetical protein|tara:strand:- start:156 stop:278 length:123 start_codon:yes stop_codon:yes gene_type:complete
LGVAGIVPQLGILGEGIQFVELANRGVIVKDASSTAQETA